MKLPNESASSWVHISYAAFTWASLDAWSHFPDMSHADRAFLASTALSMKGSVDRLLTEARDTQDELIFGRPVVAAKKNASLALLRRRASEALALVNIRVGNGSKNGKIAREFLPKLMATVTGAHRAARPNVVVQAAERLQNLSKDFDEKAALTQKLREAAAVAQEALTAGTDADVARSKERSEEVVAKGRLRLELERTHRALGAHFAGDRDFVESFFLKGNKPSEGADDKPEAAPPTPA